MSFDDLLGGMKEGWTDDIEELTQLWEKTIIRTAEFYKEHSDTLDEALYGMSNIREAMKLIEGNLEGHLRELFEEDKNE